MLDKNDKKRLAREYAALVQKIGKVLKRFTPIDPADDFCDGADYEHVVPRIVVLLVRGGGQSELLDILQATRSEYCVPPDPDKDLKIAEAILKSMKSKSQEACTATGFRLDLRADVVAAVEFFQRRVNEFARSTNPGPGESDSVTGITLGFECCQSGWLSLVFDLRAESTSDGEWTRYLDRAGVCTEKKVWCKAASANMRGSIEIVDVKGKCRTYSMEQAPLSTLVGDTIKSAALTFLKGDGLASLPLASNCQLTIEDFDGNYAWHSADITSGDAFPKTKP